MLLGFKLETEKDFHPAGRRDPHPSIFNYVKDGKVEARAAEE